ncbi:MAG TPA: FliG C-terminal domain-containing protein [Sedimentisphaerales bacterium]|nr:FliG C-terminal domain-containing protein [Sedimentisphaerales bacterium]
MALTGKQKAAMLLMSLDAATAAELLKGVKPDLVQEVAMELAYLDAAGYRRDKQSTQVARQFCNSLQAEEGFQHKSFLKEMLKSTVGDEKAEHIQTQIRNLLQIRDPFTRIRFVDSRTLASVLKREHPRAAAAVLSGLPAKKSSDVLNLLGEGIRLSVVSRMTTCENMTAQAKARMAETVCERLDAVTVDNTSEALPTRLERSLRKVAVILRNLGGELRDCLLGAVQRKDDKAGLRRAQTSASSVESSSRERRSTGSSRTAPTILWEDIPQVADRLLQRALSRVDERKLALALVGADYSLVQKIMSNISERATAIICGLKPTLPDEEVSCVSAGGNKDVEEAREEIVHVLREMNERD